ncbi:hypothetical protein EIMP302_00080 [Escherichia coli]|nr:hypothetical protein EIMP302_00080 [Escherichia coli]
MLEQGKGAQDDILMTVMLWRLDTGDIAGALEIARYALKYGLTMPGKHRRTPPYMFTEEVALAAMRAHAAGESVDTRLLTETLELTATADMPDEVRAKLHKITGLFLRDAGDAAGALAHLQRATQLDCQAGVKKRLNDWAGAETEAGAAAQSGHPRPRKTRSVTPAKRGRPKSQLTTECARAVAPVSEGESPDTAPASTARLFRGSHDDADYSAKGGSRVR